MTSIKPDSTFDVVSGLGLRPPSLLAIAGLNAFVWPVTLKGIGGSRAKNLYFFYLDICYSPIFLLSKMGSYFTQLSLLLIL